MCGVRAQDPAFPPDILEVAVGFLVFLILNITNATVDKASPFLLVICIP